MTPRGGTSPPGSPRCRLSPGSLRSRFPRRRPGSPHTPRAQPRTARSFAQAGRGGAGARSPDAAAAAILSGSGNVKGKASAQPAAGGTAEPAAFLRDAVCSDGRTASPRTAPAPVLPSAAALRGLLPAALPRGAAPAARPRRDVGAVDHRPHHGGAAQRHRLGRGQSRLQGHDPRGDGPQEEAPGL